MTRRRIIAGVILLAAVVVAVPAAPGVWRKVVYRSIDLGGMEGLTKRWAWLPGPYVYVPNQFCNYCRRAEHGYCWRVPDSALPGREGFSLYPFLDFPADFRCTCPHPSHAEDSE